MVRIPYDLSYFTFSEDKSFTLETGLGFGPITIGYETFGTLNEEKSNAILIVHALTGDSHVTSAYDKDKNTPGWWDNYVGPGKAIDTNRFFVICSNNFGGCMGTTGPASINPATGKPYGLDFPLFTIGDLVSVQKKLIDHLGIKKLKALIGGSLGGMNVLEWITRYPDSADSSIIIASTYKNSPQMIAFYEVGRNAILADPNFNNGDYYEKEQPQRGLSIARMIAHITYLSKTSIEKKFGRNLQEKIQKEGSMYSYFGPMFQIESYLRYQGKKFVERFDANTYLYITKAMDLYDLTREKSLQEITLPTTGKTLLVTFKSDWHFPPEDSWEIAKAMMNNNKEVSYVNMESPYGHDAFLIESPEFEGVLKGFLTH